MSSLWLALSANLDSFPIGMAYGIKRVRMRSFSVLLMTVLPVAGTIAGLVAGDYAALRLSAAAANGIGSALFVAIGAWTLLDSRQTATGHPASEASSPAIAIQTLSNETPEHLRHIGIRESVAVALALSINNVGGGLGAGMSGLPFSTVVALTLAFGLLFLVGGHRLGRSVQAQRDGRWATAASGSLMIGLGVFELFI